MLTFTQIENFDRLYFNGTFKGQRYGQALLNHFHEDADIAKHRTGPELWELKHKQETMNRLKELQLISYEG